MISRLDYDYLIGASHNLMNDDESHIINPYLEREYITPEVVNKVFPNYWKNPKHDAESGCFAFLSHVDLYKISKIGYGSEWNQYKMELVETLAKYNQPYEFNTSGWNKSDKQHPHIWMIKELNKRDVPVLISDDAHSTDMIGQHFARAEYLLSGIGYKNRWKTPLK